MFTCDNSKTDKIDFYSFFFLYLKGLRGEKNDMCLQLILASEMKLSSMIVTI